MNMEFKTKEWVRVRKFLEDFLKSLDISGDFNKIILICEEVYINISRYAYKNENGLVELQCGYIPSSGEIFVEFSDYGVEFDPTSVNISSENEELEKRKIGGLGILLCKKLADRLEYSRVEQKNVLRIVSYVKGC